VQRLLIGRAFVMVISFVALYGLATASVGDAGRATHGFSFASQASGGYIRCATGGGWGLLTCNRLSDGLWVQFEGVSNSSTIVIAHSHDSIPGRLPPLRADGSWSARRVACRAGVRGIICLDGHRHGWWLGRIGGERFFGPHHFP
jgi:hypothetical protein